MLRSAKVSDHARISIPLTSMFCVKSGKEENTSARSTSCRDFRKHSNALPSVRSLRHDTCRGQTKHDAALHAKSAGKNKDRNGYGDIETRRTCSDLDKHGETKSYTVKRDQSAIPELLTRTGNKSMHSNKEYCTHGNKEYCTHGNEEYCKSGIQIRDTQCGVKDSHTDELHKFIGKARNQELGKKSAAFQSVSHKVNIKSKRHDVCKDQTDVINQKIIQHLKEVNHKPRRMRRGTYSNNCGECVAPMDKPRNVVGLFRKTAVCVRCLVRLLTSMADRSSHIGPRSATEDQWHAIKAAVQGARIVEFNKAAYRMRKNVAEFPKWAWLILEKADDTRSEAELKKLHALMRGMKIFDRFTEKIQLSMCRAFTYLSVGSGRIILRQGQIGQNFYIIYSGSVFVNFVDTDAYGNQFMKTETVLKRGDSFGELALLQDIQRTATVTCREACELLVVDKDTFARVCPRIFEDEMQNKMEFITNLKLFSPRLWGMETLKTICFQAQVLEYKTNKVVVADSTTDDWIYICMEGKCQVIRRLVLSDEIESMNLRNSTRNSTGYDIDLLGNKRQSIRAEDNRASATTNPDKGRKEQLLDSMGLEYRKLKRHRLSSFGPEKVLPLSRYGRRPTLAHVGHVRSPRRSTLVDLAGQHRHVTGVDVHYLHIDMLQRGDIFNICNILSRGGGSSSGSYTLISCGARLFRVKRKSFFRNASPAILQHATSVATMARYPTDDVLLYRYKECLRWELYKRTMLHDIMHSRSHGNERSAGIATRNNGYINTEDKKNVLQKLETVIDLCDHNVPTWKKAERLTFKNTDENE